MPQIIYVEHDGTTHEVDVEVGCSVMEGAVNNGIPGIDALSDDFEVRLAVQRPGDAVAEQGMIVNHDKSNFRRHVPHLRHRPGNRV